MDTLLSPICRGLEERKKKLRRDPAKQDREYRFMSYLDVVQHLLRVPEEDLGEMQKVDAAAAPVALSWDLGKFKRVREPCIELESTADATYVHLFPDKLRNQLSVALAFSGLTSEVVVE
jgi:hypothetical protein